MLIAAAVASIGLAGAGLQPAIVADTSTPPSTPKLTPEWLEFAFVGATIETFGRLDNVVCGPADDASTNVVCYGLVRDTSATGDVEVVIGTASIVDGSLVFADIVVAGSASPTTPSTPPPETVAAEDPFVEQVRNCIAALAPEPSIPQVMNASGSAAGAEAAAEVCLVDAPVNPSIGMPAAADILDCLVIAQRQLLAIQTEFVITGNVQADSAQQFEDDIGGLVASIEANLAEGSGSPDRCVS